MNLGEELQKLADLHRAGALNDAEYAAAKARLLDSTQQAQPSFGGPAPFASDQQTRQWSMWIHFSQYAGWIAPGLGLIVPIVLWQMKKSELPGVDPHGKAVVNWILSLLIYAVVSVILAFVIIGIPLLIALAIMAFVFPVIGGIKANDGEVWNYPMSMRFFR